MSSNEKELAGNSEPITPQLEGGEMSDAELDEHAGGLTMIKNANCQDAKGALNSVVTVEASLEI